MGSHGGMREQIQNLGERRICKHIKYGYHRDQHSATSMTIGFRGHTLVEDTKVFTMQPNGTTKMIYSRQYQTDHT